VKRKGASEVNDRRRARLSLAPISPRPRPQKVTKWEIHARIGYRALRFAQSTERKAQDGLRTSDSGSPHHPLGFGVQSHVQSGAQGPAVVRIVRRPQPPEALTLATIPARTASGRRCQPAASSVVIGFATISPPKGSERLGDHQRGCLAPRLVRVTAGQDPDSKSGKKSGADR
jgi:hypothetical protein